MAKELKQNVEVGGVWYGPSYPDAGAIPADAEVGDHVYEDADTEFPAGAARQTDEQDLATGGEAPDASSSKGRTSAKG